MPIDPWATAECVCALVFAICTFRTSRITRWNWVSVLAVLSALLGMALIFTVNIRAPFGGASCALFSLAAAHFLHRQGERGFFLWMWGGAAVLSFVLGFAGR
jgi:hypothetical protein